MRKVSLQNAASLVHIHEPPMLIDQLMPVGSVTVVAGPTYSGKTFFALEAARSVAFAQPFMGHFKVHRPGNVLLIEQDSPIYDTGRALMAMIRPIYDSLLGPEGLGDYELDALQIAWHQGLNLSTNDDANCIVKTANELHTSLGWRNDPITGDPYEDSYDGCRLIILDTLARSHTSPENDNTAMQAVLSRICQIRDRTNAAILVVHHTRKPHASEYGDWTSALSIRGASAIEGTVDNIYTITASRKTGLSTMRVQKARAIRPPEFTYRIHSSTDPDGRNLKTVEFVSLLEDPRDKSESNSSPIPKLGPDTLLAWLSSSPRSIQDFPVWWTNNSISKATFYRWLRSLLASGAIRRDGDIYTVPSPENPA